jgi:4-amino-4-deoxychorismate lyase
MIFSGNKQQLHLDLNNRGLAYGDGLFETIAFINGKLHNWQAHYSRLQLGCKRLSLHCPNEADLLKQIKFKRNRLQSTQSDKQISKGILKLILTRGNGGRGYQYDKGQQPVLIICWNKWPDIPEKHYSDGIEATVCATRLALQPLLAGIKHLNRLEQVLAKNELSDTTYAEGITLDYNEQLIEGTSSNLFFVKNGHLCTPELDNCGVKGTLRSLVMQIARINDIPVSEGKYTLTDLREADEVFFTNSIIGIYPVSKLTFSEIDFIVYETKSIISFLSRIINVPLQRPVIRDEAIIQRL